MKTIEEARGRRREVADCGCAWLSELKLSGKWERRRTFVCRSRDCEHGGWDEVRVLDEPPLLLQEIEEREERAENPRTHAPRRAR